MNKKAARDSLIAKIRALLAKTVENGCTESEAMEAAAKAVEMMAKYDIELGDVEKDDNDITSREVSYDELLGVHFRAVRSAIAKLCGVKSWITIDGNNKQVSYTFFGFPHDVEIAYYLADLCTRMMRRHLDQCMKEAALYTKWKRDRLIRSYLQGLSDRLSDRIQELSWVRRKATGNALVPVKDEIIEQAFAKEDIGLKNIGGNRRRDVDTNRYLAGYKDGNSIPLNAGLKEGRAHEEAIE